MFSLGFSLVKLLVWVVRFSFYMSTHLIHAYINTCVECLRISSTYMYMHAYSVVASHGLIANLTHMHTLISTIHMHSFKTHIHPCIPKLVNYEGLNF